MEKTEHTAEPKEGSLRTADGREADLFMLEHYPIDATCRICHGAIRARSFLRPFEHLPAPCVTSIRTDSPRSTGVSVAEAPE